MSSPLGITGSTGHLVYISFYGAPDWQVDAWVSTYTAIASGELAGVTDHVQRLAGRAPMSLTQVLECT